MPTLKVWDGSAWIEVKGDKGDPGEVTNAALESRVAPIEGDVSAIDTRVTTVETETAEAVAKATRADARVFDAAAFGSTDNANIAASLQAASDAAMAETGGVGGTITLPTGSYRMAAGVDIGSNTLDLNGSTLDFIDTTSATAVTASGVYAGGSTILLPTLAATVPIRGRTLTFAGTPEVKVGDLLLIDDQSKSFVLNRGEFAKVATVSGSTVTLENPTFAAYDTTATVYRVNAVRPSVTNGRLIGKAGVRPLYIRWGDGLRLTNLDLSGSPHAQVWVGHAYDVMIDNVHAWNTSPGTSGTEYGIIIGNSQRVVINGVVTDTMRHGITTGGVLDEMGGIACRDIVIANSVVGSHGVQSPSGIGLHHNLEHCTIHNNILPSGINIGGDRLTITRNVIRRGVYQMAMYSSDSLLGWDVNISDNEIYGEGGFDSGTAIVDLQAMTRTLRDGGTLRFNRNRVYRGSFQSEGNSTRALAITQRNSPVANLNVEVIGNVFDSKGLTEPVSPAIYNDIYIATAGTPTTYNRVVIKDNQCERGAINILSSHIRTLIIDNNHVENPAYYGIYAQVPATPMVTDAAWYVRNNVVTSAHRANIFLDAYGVGRLVMQGNTAVNGNDVGDAHVVNGAGVVVRYAARPIIRNNVFGDDRATPKQAGPCVVAYATEAVYEDNEVVGTDMPSFIDVTTLRLRYRGRGAPTQACADGSTYLNVTPGAASALYVRENGAWAAK